MDPSLIHRQTPHILNESLLDGTIWVHSHSEIVFGSAAGITTVPAKECSSLDTKLYKLGQIPHSPPSSPETEAPRNSLFPNLAKTSAKYGGLVLGVLPLTKYNQCQPIQLDTIRRMKDDRFAVEYKSQIGKALKANRGQWAKRELTQVRKDNLVKSENRRRGQRTTNKTTFDVRLSANKSERRRPNVTCRSSDLVKTSRKPRVRQSDRRREVTNDAQNDKSSKNATREDKNFNSLADYCPPLSSLLARPNSLNVAWKGTPIDLGSDEFVHLLHVDELKLAGNLRLDCATYLTSKRRIFISRIAALRAGREFRKTDAQQACRIDVNKASKLWEAFYEAGWFGTEWVAGYT